jgi:hypothetical protein
MKEIVYWSGHHAFGDSFCLFAAAHIKSLETRAKIKVSCWNVFKNLANYFSNLEYIEETELNNYTRINCGADPGDYAYKFNGVTRYLKFMTDDKKTLSSGKILLNIDRHKTDKKIVSICANGNVNGLISKNVLEKMLERSTVFYPDSQIQFIGHFGADVNNHFQDLILKYNIKDDRTHDRTCDVIMDQLRHTSLLISVHTGLVFPALGLNIPVWCENSKNLQHNYLLDFPNNRPLFFS